MSLTPYAMLFKFEVRRWNNPTLRHAHKTSTGRLGAS